MVAALPNQIANEPAIFFNGALDDCRALEGIESATLATDRHQTLRSRTAGRVRWHDWSNPAALQTTQCQNASRLQPLADIAFTAGDQRKRQGGTFASGGSSCQSNTSASDTPH